jgi:hypothetical protein
LPTSSFSRVVSKYVAVLGGAEVRPQTVNTSGEWFSYGWGGFNSPSPGVQLLRDKELVYSGDGRPLTFPSIVERVFLF